MQQDSTVSSDWRALHHKLTRLVEVLPHSDEGYQHTFNPALSRDEITHVAEALSWPLPEEIYQLYTWNNGVVPNTDLFLFSDHLFLPLDQAIEEARTIETYYDLTLVIPFAAFEGSWLVLPVDPYPDLSSLWPPAPAHVKLERPVIRIFEGVEVFAYSFAIMLDMMAEWLEQHVAVATTPYELDLRARIWEKHNPGLLDIPESVYIPAEGFQQTVVILASASTAYVDEPVTLSATRSTGPWHHVEFAAVPIGTCWKRTPPPTFEAEVAGNLSWELEPAGISRFDGGRLDGTRQVVFSQPGTYRLRGHSAVWCPPGYWSNSIDIHILPR